MRNYTIHIRQGLHTNSHPVSLSDVDAARREAIAMFAELARGIASKLPNRADWRIEVIEPAGRTVFRLGILAEDAALAVFSLDGRERRPRTLERKIARHKLLARTVSNYKTKQHMKEIGAVLEEELRTRSHRH
jgi:hypothetical protein